ncbi:MAG: LytTR family DNA-binding domain-containing protein [Lachnospiraceae bacterium]|nr:LytTR family DNA-binding domain-containing protein [Lachnospiraceae bacterium]
MFNIIICDDNEIFARYEEKLIRNILETNVKDEYKIYLYFSREELLSNNDNLCDIDLILMDVELGDNNGIDILKNINNIDQTVVAIVSSFIDYAPEGYKVKAYRYLLKSSSAFEEGLREIIEYAYGKFCKSQRRIFQYEFREKKLLFTFNDLIYVESKLHYLYFHFKEKEQVYSIRKTLDEIEKELECSIFLRVHKSILVNVNYIKDIRKYEVELFNGTMLSVAQGKYEDVIMRYGHYIGEQYD